MTEAQQLAANFAGTVSTEGRVLNTMYVNGKEYHRVTDVAYDAFKAGYEAAQAANGLTIKQLFEANLSRVAKWHRLESWSPLEWAGAMCGEAGEAANFAKKLKRVMDEIANNDQRMFGKTVPKADLVPIYSEGVIKEYADTLIYGVLLCASVGATADDVQRIILQVFNQKSEEYGFPERL